MLLLALVFTGFGGLLLHTQAQVRSDRTQADILTRRGNIISYRHRYEHNIIVVTTPSSELSCSIIVIFVIVELLLHLIPLLSFSFSRPPGLLSARPQFYLSADSCPAYWPTGVAMQKNVTNYTASSEEQRSQTCNSRWKQPERILTLVMIKYSEFYS